MAAAHEDREAARRTLQVLAGLAGAQVGLRLVDVAADTSDRTDWALLVGSIAVLAFFVYLARRHKASAQTNDDDDN